MSAGSGMGISYGYRYFIDTECLKSAFYYIGARALDGKPLPSWTKIGALLGKHWRPPG